MSRGRTQSRFRTVEEGGGRVEVAKLARGDDGRAAECVLRACMHEGG